MRGRRLLVGDALKQLQALPEACVDVVVTSPPYFQLRDYQMPGQIGLEDTPQQWVDKLTAIGHEIARVLTPSGTWWLNLGDSYSRGNTAGVPAKSLVLAPERLLLALADAGWIVRNKVVWAKTNPLPTSARDRLACTWEPVYLLSRARRYYFHLDAIRQPHRSRPHLAQAQAPPRENKPNWAGPLAGDQHGLNVLKARGLVGHPLGKNPGDVWTMATSRYPSAGIAVLPQQLVERILLAACPQRVCPGCNRPSDPGVTDPGCDCGGLTRPGRVLDPFLGTGTTAVVAQRLGLDWIGIELNPELADVARRRLAEGSVKEAA